MWHGNAIICLSQFGTCKARLYLASAWGFPLSLGTICRQALGIAARPVGIDAVGDGCGTWSSALLFQALYPFGANRRLNAKVWSRTTALVSRAAEISVPLQQEPAEACAQCRWALSIGNEHFILYYTFKRSDAAVSSSNRFKTPSGLLEKIQVWNLS